MHAPRGTQHRTPATASVYQRLLQLRVRIQTVRCHEATRVAESIHLLPSIRPVRAGCVCGHVGDTPPRDSRHARPGDQRGSYQQAMWCAYDSDASELALFVGAQSMCSCLYTLRPRRRGLEEGSELFQGICYAIAIRWRSCYRRCASQPPHATACTKTRTTGQASPSATQDRGHRHRVSNRALGQPGTTASSRLFIT